MIFFGYFAGLPYKDSDEKFDDYRKYRNRLPKEKIVAHIEGLEEWFTSLPSKEIFTGEPLQAGMYIDGDFRFPLEFLHYYKNYDIGIPYEYEEYLKKILDC